LVDIQRPDFPLVPLSGQNKTAVERAGLELLETWLDRILDAKTADELFVPTENAH